MHTATESKSSISVKPERGKRLSIIGLPGCFRHYHLTAHCYYPTSNPIHQKDRPLKALKVLWIWRNCHLNWNYLSHSCLLMKTGLLIHCR
jgi:hypothetical protein